MKRSGLIDAQGRALAAAINSEAAGERTNRASYSAHEGKLYVEKDQSARSDIYLSTKLWRELAAEKKREHTFTGFQERYGDLRRVMNIPELDLKLLKLVHPEARESAPAKVRADFMMRESFLHPEWVVI